MAGARARLLAPRSAAADRRWCRPSRWRPRDQGRPRARRRQRAPRGGAGARGRQAAAARAGPAARRRARGRRARGNGQTSGHGDASAAAGRARHAGQRAAGALSPSAAQSPTTCAKAASPIGSTATRAVSSWPRERALPGSACGARSATARSSKEYLALVAGTPPDGGVVDAPLVHAGKRVRASAAGEAEAQSATTRYETLARGEGVALVRASSASGRMHQIRAHLAHAGFPIVGDALYGGPPPAPGTLGPLSACLAGDLPASDDGSAHDVDGASTGRPRRGVACAGRLAAQDALTDPRDGQREIGLTNFAATE